MVLNHQHSEVLGSRCTQKWQNGWKCGWNLVEKDKITQEASFSSSKKKNHQTRRVPLRS